MRYRNPLFVRGAALTAASLLGIAALLFVRKVR
jgi:hypothetical protein